MSPYVRGAALSNYPEVAAQVGLDAQAMLRRVGIDRRALTDPDMRIPGGPVAELLEISAVESGCATFGLRMGESRRLSNFGALSLLIAHQATMREALETLVRYRHMLNESLVVHIEEHPDVVVVREELTIVSPRSMRQAYELAVGVMYRLFRAVLGPRWRAETVNFTHSAPADLTVHRRIFGGIVEFDSDFNGLTCRQADLCAANPSADPQLAVFAERFVQTLPNADRGSLSQDVRKAIYQLLPTGKASIRKVAANLGLAERTLQRRLLAEETDFTRLLNDVRKELTLRYLANGRLPMARVAGLVGYSRQSSFNRWFAEEFGAAPTTWRLAAGGAQ